MNKYDEIAGADYEREYPGRCSQCGANDLYELAYGGEHWVVCGECGHQFDLSYGGQMDEPT